MTLFLNVLLHQLSWEMFVLALAVRLGARFLNELG
jgi:hypothetical protein